MAGVTRLFPWLPFNLERVVIRAQAGGGSLARQARRAGMPTSTYRRLTGRLRGFEGIPRPRAATVQRALDQSRRVSGGIRAVTTRYDADLWDRSNLNRLRRPQDATRVRYVIQNPERAAETDHFVTSEWSVLTDAPLFDQAQDSVLDTTNITGVIFDVPDEAAAPYELRHPPR